MACVTYSAIPVSDLPRAVEFYQHVFGVELEIAEIDGNEMALFPAIEGSGGASGALAKGESYVPSLDGTRICFVVQGLEQTMRRALGQGGREV